MQYIKHNIDSLALLNVPVDFDELSICVLNGLGSACSNISHALLLGVKGGISCQKQWKRKKISTKPSQGSLGASNLVLYKREGARLPCVGFKNRSTGGAV